jgi:hypothetical protein
VVYSQYKDPVREARDIIKRNTERRAEVKRRSSGTSTAKIQLPIHEITPTGEEGRLLDAGSSGSTSTSPDGSTTTIKRLGASQVDPIRTIDLAGGGQVTLRGKEVWKNPSSGGGATTTVTSGRGVTQGGVTYTGNAVVPNTGGKTANQIKREAKSRAVSEGITGGFTTTYNASTNVPVNTPVSVRYSGGATAEQAQTIAGNLGYSQAYLYEGTGTPTSVSTIKAAEADINKDRTYTAPPTYKDVAPTTLWGKTKMSLQTIYAASPFGMTTTLPDETHRLRETGASRWFNTLTIKEAATGLLNQRVKDARADQQITAINKFSTDLEAAPEDIKYSVYQAGRKDLQMVGVKSFENEGGTLDLVSPQLKASTSQNVYDWRASKGNTAARTALVLRAGSAEGAKVIGGGYVIGAGVGAVATATGITRLATAAPKIYKAGKYTLVGAQVGAVGLWGASAGYTIYKTPASDRGIKYAEVAGQGLGIGALFAQGALNRRANARNVAANRRIAAKNTAIKMRGEQLKNIKKYGLNSKYAKTSYKLAGTGKQLSPTVRSSLAKRYGVSNKIVQESTLYRQYKMVKSPTGLKPYKTGKYGVSFRVGNVERGATFRIYNNRVTSLAPRNTYRVGKFSFTTEYTTKGKNLIQTRFMSKTYKSIKFDYKASFGRTVKGGRYLTETRLVPRGARGTTPAKLWKNIGSTYRISTGVSQQRQIPLLTDIGSGLKARTGSYGVLSSGIGQPYTPTKTASIGNLVMKPSKGGFNRLDYNAWKPAIKPSSIGVSSGGGGTKTVTKTVTSGLKYVQPTINTLTVAAPQARLTPLLDVKASTALFSVLGVSTITAVKNIQSVRSRNKSRSVITTLQAPTVDTASLTNTATDTATTTVTTPRFSTPTFTTTPTPLTSTPTGGGGRGRPTNPRVGDPLIGGGLALPSFNFAGGRIGIGRVGAKGKYGYTPSFTALAFGIRGKKVAPKIGKRYTGLEFRPITKGWLNQFKSKRRFNY